MSAHAKRSCYESGQTLIEVLAAVAIGVVVTVALVSLSSQALRTANFSKNSARATALADQGMEEIKHLRDTNALNTIDDPCAPNCSDPNDGVGIMFAPTGGGTNCKTKNASESFYTWESFYAEVNVDDADPTCTIYGEKGYIHPPLVSKNPLKHFVDSEGNPIDIGWTSSWALHFTDDDGWPPGDPYKWEEVPTENIIFRRFVYVADTPIVSGGKSSCNQTSDDWQQIKQFTVTVSWTDSSGIHDSVVTNCITN